MNDEILKVNNKKINLTKLVKITTKCIKCNSILDMQAYFLSTDPVCTNCFNKQIEELKKL